ncbi:hypothetical protein BVRB_6g133200 [Beta vulgaris subsp. vulgaris]|nr:hypothetical protein BVRB_6g133200 [Beta vulgaris subsp. vulgaris]
MRCKEHIHVHNSSRYSSVSREATITKDLHKIRDLSRRQEQNPLSLCVLWFELVLRGPGRN